MTDAMLINLSIISKVALSDKIYISDTGFLSIENNTIFQGVIRFIFRNGREKTISNLKNFYDSVFAYIDNTLPLASHYHKKEVNRQRDGKDKANNPFDNENCKLEMLRTGDKDHNLKTLLIYLRKSMSGLENLRETYSSDIVMTSKLDIILDNVRLYVSRLEKKINSFDTNSV